MEADISIWRKTGHFYFALTRGRVLRISCLVRFLLIVGAEVISSPVQLVPTNALVVINRPTPESSANRTYCLSPGRTRLPDVWSPGTGHVR